MATRMLPSAFGHLLSARNLAADDALARALPYMAPFHQAAALELLLQRGHAHGLARVVGRFDKAPQVLRRMLVARAVDLSAGLRVALSSSSSPSRQNVIEIILRAVCGRLAYLLVDALCVRDRKVRASAAAALLRLTEILLGRLESAATGEDIAAARGELSGVTEAVSAAVRRWEGHLQPEILDAAARLGDAAEPEIRAKLARPRATVGRSFTALLTNSRGPRHVGFTLRALAIPELRSAASTTIALRLEHDGTFLRALVSQSWLLCDGEIRRGLRGVRPGPWLDAVRASFQELDDGEAACAVRILSATGGSPEQKAAMLHEWIGSEREAVRRAAVWHLIHDRSEMSTGLLRIVAVRPADCTARLAAREVLRRRPDRTGAVAHPTGESSDAAHQNLNAFERFWDRFDDFPSGDHMLEADTLRRLGLDIGRLLRGKLATPEPLDRVRALRITTTLRMLDELQEPIRRLAGDPDPIVRGPAVNLLAELPGVTSERMLRAAVNDPDHRVQANAIEGLDRLDVADRAGVVLPKLESRDNRVRANAVRSLLRLESREAAGALLDMLEDPSPTHRISALWVVERAASRAVLGRVRDLRDHDADPRVRRRAGNALDRLACGDFGGFSRSLISAGREAEETAGGRP